jgi:ribose/xylose/arabinose/galactoside ABC-type transport system permease subunit
VFEFESIAVLRRFPGLALLILFIVLFSLFSVFARRFLSAANIEDLLAGYSFMAILAIGQAFPIIARGVDLSVGSNVGLGAMIERSRCCGGAGGGRMV